MSMVIADMQATITFLNNNGIIHLDTDFFNMLTDGKRVYLTDFGLALDRRFALTPAEEAFYKQNIDYDYGSLLWSLGFHLFWMYSGLPDADKHRISEQFGIREGIGFEETMAILLNNVDKLAATGIMKLTRSYVISIAKYRSVITFMHDFYSAMRRNNKKDTQFQHATLRRLLRETGFVPAEPLETPDFDQLWDYDDPAATEQHFRELLSRIPTGTIAYQELLTQIARAQGLQHDFDAAHHTLDTVERALASGGERVHIRYLLERGRAFNSARQPERARPLFLEAWERAQLAGEDLYAIDAAHMLAIVDPSEQSLAWNLRALELAERTADQRAKKWLGSLCNNIGWTYHDAGQYDQALALFEQALAYREAQGQEREARIARWCVARALRSLGRTEQALTIQQALLEANQRDGATDGFVFEELAECLLALGHPAEARPYFARAYAELSRDPWLVEGEPERLDRLKMLGSE
jgi:tetratricopeptide (TPR) repeat protein